MKGGEFEGRVALVTGAAGEGIGRATARCLGQRGARIVVADVHARRVGEVVGALTSELGDRVVGSCFDVADRAAVDDALAGIERDFGSVDLLVNNAAINLRAPIRETPPEDWDRVIALDLSGCFYLIRKLLPGMMERGRGAIVNVGSIAAFGSLGDLDGPYAAAKAGLLGLTRAVAIEGGPRGVRCNAVAPGLVWSKFVRKQPELFRPQLDATPLGRFAEPEDVANVIAFLCSEQSRHVTGETVNVSGGAYLRA